MTESQTSPTNTTESHPRLRSVLTLELHSDIAHDYVRSHNPPHPDAKRQPGLLEFTRRVRGVYVDASYNNPYADWTLLKVEEDIKTLRDSIDRHRAQLREKLSELDGDVLEPAVAEVPHRDQVEFDTPYAYVLGVALGEFDTLVREAMTAAHAGAIRPRERTEIFQAITRQIRRMLMTPHHYVRTRITRSSVGQEDVAQIAILETRLGGSLPHDVLSGEGRGDFAPDIVDEPSKSLTN